MYEYLNFLKINHLTHSFTKYLQITLKATKLHKSTAKKDMEKLEQLENE